MAEDIGTVRGLVNWASKYEIPLHSQVEVYQDPVTGLSFRAREDLPPGTKIVDCSYKLSLSYLNAISAAPDFPRHGSVPFPPEFIEHMEQEDPHIIGHFFLMQQYLRSEKSVWSPYIRLLPQPDELERLGFPNWWPEADRKFLQATNAEPSVGKRDKIWHEAWEKGHTLLEGRFKNWTAYTHSLYRWAATIYDSRSFRPSVTIPTQLVARPQVVDHMVKDRFAVLFPLLDIGNHNGIDQAEWIPDAAASHLSLVIPEAIPKGSQIFNYYGNKSNSELLIAYGFILPLPENEKFNLKVHPLPEVEQLRRSQSCHRRFYTRPGEEWRFYVRTNNGDPDVQTVLGTFSEGFVDTIVCMSANSREREFILQNPGYCIEKVPDPFQGPLSRALIRGLRVAVLKLQKDVKKLENIGAELGQPQNKNQELAVNYRQGQLRVLKGALDLAARHGLQTTSFNCLCPHEEANLGMNKSAPFLSLECAYAWLERYYPSEGATVVQWISKDQDESLPLNWAVLIEDWNNTYWIVWIFVIWMLRKRDFEKFSVEHENLHSWLGSWAEKFGSECSNQASKQLHAERTEEETIDSTIKSILQQPSFKDIAERELTNINSEKRLRNYISYVVHEETISMEYMMRHPLQNGESLPQKMLYIGMTKPHNDSKPDED